MEVPTYDNPQLRKLFADNGNKARLDLSDKGLTDRDMEIVANVLETNTVRDYYFFLSFRLLELYKSRGFQRATSIVSQSFFLFSKN
jgi:hypothetical protein